MTIGPVARIPIERPRVADETTQRALADLQRRLSELPPFARGVELTDIVFTAGQTQTLTHGLGRTPARWFVIRAQGSAPELFETAGTANQITLTHSGAAETTVSLWVS